jgi:hypothetical protein
VGLCFERALLERKALGLPRWYSFGQMMENFDISAKGLILATDNSQASLSCKQHWVIRTAELDSVSVLGLLEQMR